MEVFGGGRDGDISPACRDEDFRPLPQAVRSEEIEHRIAVVLLLGGLAGVGCVGKSRENRPLSVTKIAAPASLRAAYDSTLAQRNVEFHAARVRRDPEGAIGWRMLAEACLQRARETGDLQDAARAEEAARRSLKIRVKFNAAAACALASCLVMQHRFAEADAAARQAEAIEPGNGQARRLRLEVALERGDYEAAQRMLRHLPEPDSPAAKVVRARMEEINGLPQNALRLLREAQESADRNREMPHAAVAWFHLRVGDLFFGIGQADQAERAYRECLTLFPRDYRAMAALARLAAGRNDWKAALEWGRKSAEIVPNPETLAVIGDAYLALGQKADAEREYRLIEAAGRLAQAQGAAYDRQRALFLADHDRNLAEALTLARRELESRHDFAAYDTLAWVCFKHGKITEAASAIKRALRRGTKDARLYYHAGRIALARGDRDEARKMLETALKINPYFHPFAPAEARRLLATL